MISTGLNAAESGLNIGSWPSWPIGWSLKNWIRPIGTGIVNLGAPVARLLFFTARYAGLYRRTLPSRLKDTPPMPTRRAPNEQPPRAAPVAHTRVPGRPRSRAPPPPRPVPAPGEPGGGAGRGWGAGQILAPPAP